MTSLAPTLGPQVAHFINTNGVHGPGDLIGQRFQLSFEELGFVYRVYELIEDPYRPGRWRRRYRQGIYSRRKGMRKSELMAQITLAEFDGPVRFSGRWAEGGEVDEWGYVFSTGEPIGQRVKSPEIPVVATTEEQAERLVWGVIRYVFLHTPLAARYTVQNEQIYFDGQPREAGWAYLIPPTNSDAADGAKPTFTPREEPHLWTTKPLRETAETMERNSIKRQAADPWTMDATTTFGPGEESVLELSVLAIKAGDDSILYDHLQADTKWDLTDDDEWLEAVRQASGDAWPWTNVAGQRSLWLSPKQSEAKFRRFQLNQAVAVENKPFSGDKFDVFEDDGRTPAPNRDVPVLVFIEGKKASDSTAVVCWTLDARPHLWLPGLWANPDASLREGWRVPMTEVESLMSRLHGEFKVVYLGGNNTGSWSPELTAWSERWGDKHVVNVPTRRGKMMDTAIRRFEEDWALGLVGDAPTPWTHDGSPELRRHFAAAVVEAQAGDRGFRSMHQASEGEADMIDAAKAAVAGYALIPAARVRLDELTPVKAGIF